MHRGLEHLPEGEERKVQAIPQAMRVSWIGEHELRYSRGGVVRRRPRGAQRRYKGKLFTLFNYYDFKELMVLAQGRETLRRLAESL